MNTVNLIIKKEVIELYNSNYTFVTLAVYFCVLGFICWFSPINVFNEHEAPLTNLFEIFYWCFFFLVPLFTINSISGEMKEKTFELLLTKQVQTWHIITGKFYAFNVVPILITLLLTVPYYITISCLANIDHSRGFWGYMALFWVGQCYVSIGMLASSLTKNLIFAYFISLGIGIWFHFLFDQVADLFGPSWIGNIFDYLSINEHFDSMSRGVLDTRDVIYFFSFVTMFSGFIRYFVSKTRYK